MTGRLIYIFVCINRHNVIFMEKLRAFTTGEDHSQITDKKTKPIIYKAWLMLALKLEALVFYYHFQALRMHKQLFIQAYSCFLDSLTMVDRVFVVFRMWDVNIPDTMTMTQGSVFKCRCHKAKHGCVVWLSVSTAQPLTG